MTPRTCIYLTFGEQRSRFHFKNEPALATGPSGQNPSNDSMLFAGLLFAWQDVLHGNPLGLSDNIVAPATAGSNVITLC